MNSKNIQDFIATGQKNGETFANSGLAGWKFFMNAKEYKQTMRTTGKILVGSALISAIALSAGAYARYRREKEDKVYLKRIKDMALRNDKFLEPSKTD